MKRYLGCKCATLLPFSTKVDRCPKCQRLYRVVTEREVKQQRLVDAAPALLEACTLIAALWPTFGPLAQTGAQGQVLKHVQAAITLALAEPHA